MEVGSRDEWMARRRGAHDEARGEVGSEHRGVDGEAEGEAYRRHHPAAEHTAQCHDDAAQRVCGESAYR